MEVLAFNQKKYKFPVIVMPNPTTEREVHEGHNSGVINDALPRPHHFLAMAPLIEEDKTPLNLHTAAATLAYYNKKHHTDYELVEALDSTGFLAPNCWCHTSFTAKPKTVPHNGDSSAKLFFAEFEVVYPGPRDLFHCCRILDGVKTVIGCEQCKSLLHPTTGFRKGLYRKEYRALRPRNNRGRVRSCSEMSMRVDTSSSSKMAMRVDTSTSSKKSRLG